jgi:hypothetical protein
MQDAQTRFSAALGARVGAAAMIAAASLLTCSCAQDDLPGRVRAPTGSRLVLQSGHWRGPVRQTMVDFRVDSVAVDKVGIRVSGWLLDPTIKNSPEHPTTFADRPTTCKRKPDGRSFDCARYTDMHIDNGFLCGVYTLRDDTSRICFPPVL